ncbi:MAG: hypothetical protein GF334_07165 [Candidatus Altiarchaeales archaeon]|nr:hypothetical protein [Candidatus Altiarchaeales archaeon]
MPKPPKQLTKQIKVLEGTISNLSDIVDDKKIKVEYYGEDFLKPLAEIRQEALALRSKLEIFKSQLEEALTAQYYNNERFASTKTRVIDAYLADQS